MKKTQFFFFGHYHRKSKKGGRGFWGRVMAGAKGKSGPGLGQEGRRGNGKGGPFNYHHRWEDR